MATTQEFADKVCRRITPFGDVRSRKMFGEYLVYVNERPVLTLCDNRVFVKKLPQVAVLMADAECGYPYEGAKATMRGSMHCSRCSWSTRRCPGRAKRNRNKRTAA